MDGTLDELVGEEKIDLEVVTTYANDSNYVKDICTHLIKATELLYIESDTVIEELLSREPNRIESVAYGSSIN